MVHVNGIIESLLALRTFFVFALSVFRFAGAPHEPCRFADSRTVRPG